MIRIGNKTVRFKRENEWGFMATVDDGDETKRIPLLLEKDVVVTAAPMLRKLKPIESLEFFRMVVAGCFSICMKYKRA